MGWVDQIKQYGRSGQRLGRNVARRAADAAMSQPEIRKRVELAQAAFDDMLVEANRRFDDIETSLWEKVRQIEADVRRADRHKQRQRDAARYYALLGLTEGATLEQVKTAYRRKMRSAHPDRHANDPTAETQAHVRAQAINRAYAELTALLTGREDRRARA